MATSGVIYILNAGRSVTTDTLVKICAALHCGIEDIMDVVEE